jgi:transglutaminase-like putative cysteine protease
MHIRIRHETTYRYDAPVKAALQRLLLTPRNFYGQHVPSWRIDIDCDARLHQSEDAFGNIVHCFSAQGPLESITTLVEGEVDTFDTAGVVNGAVERFPPELYLRETPLTAPCEAIRDFAHEATGVERERLDKLHALLIALNKAVEFDTRTSHTGTTASDAFAQKTGVCQDLAHIFIACSRVIGVPARYISGYFRRSDGADNQAATHAWAEAFVEDLGWVGFDPANAQSPDDAYVRVAAALDYLGAAPVRGSRTGGGDESMEVKVRVDMARSQRQN